MTASRLKRRVLLFKNRKWFPLLLGKSMTRIPGAPLVSAQSERERARESDVARVSMAKFAPIVMSFRESMW